MSNYTENKTPKLIINTLEDQSKLPEITVGENEIILVPDETEEEIAKKQDKLVAGTNITLVDDPLTQTTLISSIAQESFFRGRWANWSLAPSNGNEYPEDYHGNRKPTDNDFMVLSDASDYVNPSSLTHQFTVINLHPTTAFTIKFIDEYGTEHTYYYSAYQNKWVQINEYYSLWYSAGAPGRWYIRTNKPEDTHIVIDGIEYEVDPTGTTVGAGVLVSSTVSTTPTTGGLPSQVGQYQGAWRFVYHGAWDTNGKLGWTPQYQIENTLPIATDTVAGIAKLYTDLGENTDGAVDQATVTTELNKKQDALTAGTNITIENNVISSTASESFYKGTYENWSLVPTNGNAYPDTPRGSGNHKPTYTDYIIIQDASTVPGGQVDISMTMETDAYSSNPNKKLETVIDGNVYNGTGTFYDGNIQVYKDAAGGNYSVHWKTLKNPVEYQGQTYQPGSDFLTLIINPSNNGTRNAQLSLGNPYEGTWRFSYDGVWDNDNKNGWKGEYKVEDTLPDATDQVKGIAKLYTTTGQNEDGSMTQKSITDALDTKQDKLVAGNNITIDANNRIYTEDKTLVSFVIWEDEE